MSVEIRHITKLFGKQKALDEVSFTVERGEVVGFLGPNGAGKSTLMKIITGYLPASAGEVLVNGCKVQANSTNLKQEIGYLPENNPLYADLYVKEFLEISAGFYRLPNKKKRVTEMIGLTRLEREQHKKIGALSKGYRQRVGLAQALIHNPQVLILDEPTTGLDPNQIDEIRALIREISREKTVILSSHIMQEIEAVCSRAVIINLGKLVADGEIGQLKSGVIGQRQVVVAGFDRPVTRAELLQIGGVADAQPEAGNWLLKAASEEDIRPALFRFAVDSGRILLTLHEKQQNLENVFRKLTRS